jgi:hypothetical protein
MGFLLWETLRMEGETVKRRNGKLYVERRRRGAGGATTRSQATKKARKPPVGRQKGGTPDGEHAEGSEL